MPRDQIGSASGFMYSCRGLNTVALTGLAMPADRREYMSVFAWIFLRVLPNAPNMVTGLSVPTAGCWELAAHYTPAPDNI